MPRNSTARCAIALPLHIGVVQQPHHQIVYKAAFMCGKLAMRRAACVWHAQDIHSVLADDHAAHACAVLSTQSPPLFIVRTIHNNVTLTQCQILATIRPHEGQLTEQPPD
jgi:hypothetical protein